MVLRGRVWEVGMTEGRKRLRRGQSMGVVTAQAVVKEEWISGSGMVDSSQEKMDM